MRDLNHFSLPQDITLIHYTGDITLTGPSEQEETTTLDLLIRHLYTRKWKNKSNRNSGEFNISEISTGCDVGHVEICLLRRKITGCIWSILQLKQSETKKAQCLETQYLVGLSGFWRQHIPHLGVLFSPIYWVTQKAANFQWGPEQEKALQ